ncbi:ComEC/Rec2 family competence protein [Dyadobacter arcticus]|uniref:Beta-lactamase superfamily II metal-dependent hydrolase n=1 Tax=Dyadobacter arcticus TaxID=1078754 RepID=A0ABX0UHF7_9BACT|nr:MBL fold metallo-hydrolase [Dyadobacter arcticus]NIJ52458.1 beta-lactamase superfamily II metal-dependent hydrolase [Dyadobacter arcticus]
MKKAVPVFAYQIFFLLLFISKSYAQQPGQTLDGWKEGYLDIHHINTGGGNATFFILPDGTTLLIDAGALDPTEPRTMGPRNTKVKPDTTRQPGEWIARYISKAMEFRAKEKSLDYALITHFHDDHMGEVSGISKKSKQGPYMLTGITEVGDWLPIGKMIDRGWPDYTFPKVTDTKTMANYRSFLDWNAKNKGMKIGKAAPGRNDQLTLIRNPKKYAGVFEIRNVAANGEVWTGVGTETRAQFPDLKTLSPQLFPSENMCSIALRISYGKFDYFTGGDLPGIVRPGMPQWQDMETPVAKAVGPVEMQILDHHGNRDSQNEMMLKTLRPRVLIIPVWSSDHPGHDVLDRIYSQNIYPGERDVFATDMLEPNKLVIGELLDRLKSDSGHIVVRVEPGGDRYHVFILDDRNEECKIKSVHGPYIAR